MGAQDVDEMFLQNLEEFVIDENKLVTYKWLSRTLQVHVNLAKQMLFAFVEEQRNKKDNDNLAVTYAVAGQAADKHGTSYNKVQVVREEDLEATKSQLKKLTSCHIYSIQKSKLNDTNPLYTTDYSAFKEDIYSSNRFSSITCPAVVCRNTDELESLRKNVMPTQSEPAFSAERESEKMGGSSKAKNGTTNKQAGIAGMFGNAKPKTSKASEGDSEKKSQVKSETKPAAKPAKGVVAFFSNHAVKPKKEPAQTETPKEIKEEISKDEMEKENKSKNKSKTEVKKSEPKKSDKKTSNSRKKSVLSDEEDPLPQKKRRRIKHKEWESSSEEEEEMETEEPIPTPPRSPTPPLVEVEASPPPSPIPPTPKEESRSQKIISQNKVKGKRRKRVQKTKTFQNDDGYFVTEKVWESEYSDCSDDDVVVTKEEDAKVKIESPSKANGTQKKMVVEEKKKKSPPTKKGKAASNSKQMSMMSFFKKQ